MKTKAREFFTTMVLGAVIGCTGLVAEPDAPRAGETDLDGLPPARQTGGSCGFFANVPAVTLATGMDISASKPFIQSIYGLKSGDFRYQHSFDKRVFYELFALPYQETRIVHPTGSLETLMPVVRQIITETFNNGFANGQVYSLRVRGAFNGPHNMLLLGRRDGNYVLHDPFPGTIVEASLDQLARLMLVRSTTRVNRDKMVFVTHFLTITLPPRPAGKIIPVDSLPTSLDVVLSDAQREKVAAILMPPREPVAGTKIGEFMDAYPDLDFAALHGKGKAASARNVISRSLKADDLSGLLNLSKFTLNTWNQKRRPLLPVLVMNDRPWVLIRYFAPDPGDEEKATLVFDDGKGILRLSPRESLSRIKANGALYATLKLEWD